MNRYQGKHSGGLSPSFLFLYNLLGEIWVKPPSCPLLSQQHILSLKEQVFIITEAFIFYSRGEFHEFGNSRLNWQLQVELATPGLVADILKEEIKILNSLIPLFIRPLNIC